MAVAAPEHRIAALLTALGTEVADTVLSTLSEEHRTRVEAMLRQYEDEPLDDEELDEILADFMRFFRFALQQARASSSEGQGALPEEPSGDEGAEMEHVNDESTSHHEPEVRIFEPTEDPIADLARLQPYQIAGALVQENPRTMALVLNCLPPSQAGMALQQLPEVVRGPAFMALRNPPVAPAPLLHRLVRRTVEKGCRLDASVLADPSAESNRRIADMLRVMGQVERSAMIKSLEEVDADSAAIIKRMLYLFEDLRRVADRSIQKILAEVDSGSLAMALKGADQDIQDKILNNMSKRARGTLVEEMEFLAAVKPNEQAVARQAISEVMARLDEAGDLQIE